MAGVGRPTKLNKIVHDTIVAAIKRGNYIEVAAQLAGVDKATLYRWLKRGNAERERVAKASHHSVKVTKAEAPYVEFCDAIKKAVAFSEDEALSSIEEAGQGYPVTKTKTVIRIEGGTFNAETGEVENGTIVEVVTTEETTTKRDWQASAWRLERRNPKRWGKKQAIELKDERPQSFTVTIQDAFEDDDEDQDPSNPNPDPEGVDPTSGDTDGADDGEWDDDDDPIAAGRAAVGEDLEDEFGEDFYAEVAGG